MERERTAKPAPKRRQDKRQRPHRQSDMRDQYKKVDRPHPPRSREQSIAVEKVIGDIRHQKQRRKHGGSEHESHMRNAIPATNIYVSEYQANRAQRVERRIRSRESLHPIRSRHLALEVDQPDQK